MTSILVVEDELNLQKILKYDLLHEGFIIEVVGDGDKAAEIINNATTQFEIYILDWMLPGKNGLELCQLVRSKNKTAHIIMLTARADEFDKVDAFNLGADDYITKPFSNRELVARIHSVVRKQQTKPINPLNNESIKLHNITIIPERYEVFKDNKKIELTLREYQLLIYMIDHKNKVVSREQVLEALWGYSYDGDTRTIDVHMFKLRSKLEDDNISFKTVRGIGYMLEVK